MPPYDRERRRRRNRRLSLLGLIAVLVLGAAATVYAIQRNRSDSAARQRVVESAHAFDQGEYEQVIDLLEDPDTPTNTLRIIQGDADALWHYVVARQNVAMPNAEHIRLLFPALRQVVSLDPGNREAGQMLLELLMAIDRNTEALDTATRLIAAHPNDVELLRVRGALNTVLDNDEAALDDALAASQLEPLDVRTQMDVANLMKELHRDGEAFHQRATALYEANPGDPRAEVILARANLLIGLGLQAQDLLKSAADRDPPNDDFVRIMVDSLDRMSDFAASYDYLARVTGPGLTNALQYELYFRDFEAENDAAVIERAATLDRDTAHPNILAIAALSHYRLDDMDKARALLSQLDQRENDALASHWARSLKAWWAPTPDPARLVQTFAEACKDNPNHAYLHQLLADAYRSVGERESAIAALRVTHTYRPSWAHPYALHAELLLELDRPAEAVGVARAALRRRAVPAYAAIYAVAQARAASDSIAFEQALNYIDDKVLAQFPNEPRSFVAAVELLARTGERDKAALRIRAALERETPLPQATLLELAGISRKYRLDMDHAIFAQAQAVYGVSPRVLLDQAVILAERSGPDDAIALLRGAMPEPAPLEWRVAEAQLLQHLGVPAATGLWIALANDHPDQLQVQRLALAAVGVVEDRAFADRVINRMRDLAGADSIGWKIERARYLLGASDPAASARTAADLLRTVIATAPNRVEPYRLLARCQQLTGDDVAAARSLEQAANLAPDDMRIQFQLGQLFQNQKNYIAARQPLLRVARNERLDPNLRLTALQMLSENGKQQGEVDTLIPYLEDMQGQFDMPDHGAMLLANLYQITGRTRDVDEICEQMLRNPTPASLNYAAGYYWQTGRRDEANRVMAMIDDVEMEEDTRHTLLGWHANRMRDPDTAMDHIRTAARIVPEQSARWHTLVSLGLYYGRPEDAIRDANEALTHLPDDPAMRAIVNNDDLLRQVAVDTRFRPMAVAIVESDPYRAVGARALRMIVEASEAGRSTGAVARELAELANNNPEFLELQNLSAAMLSNVNQHALAAEIATRTMETFPNDAISAQLSAMSLARTGDWRRALSAAQAWGRRNPGLRPQADVYVSMSQRNLSRVGDALVTLAPYTERALAEPDAFGPLLGEYATALVQDGQFDKAWNTVLATNLDRGLSWRRLALDLASGALPSARMATAWLDAVQAAVPANAPGEMLLVAQANFIAGDRLRDADLIDRARIQIESATQSVDAPAEAWLLRGRIADRSGDLQTAQASYSEALRVQPNNPLAQNNLAMVLYARGRDLDQAIRLTRAACASAPGNINYQDTLAKVLSRAGQHDEAIQVIERVIQQDRQNLEWLRTKAELLDAAGRHDEADRFRDSYNLNE